jgi:hypothetical protein
MNVTTQGFLKLNAEQDLPRSTLHLPGYGLSRTVPGKFFEVFFASFVV